MSTNLPFNGSRWRAQPGLDYFADIVDTRAINLDRPGSIALARKPMAIITSAEEATFGLPLAYASDDDVYYIVTDEGAWSFDPLDGSVVELDQASAPDFSLRSDGVMFAGTLHSSFNQAVESYNSGPDTWTERITGLDSAYPHPLCNFESANKLAVGNGNEVELYDSGYSLDATLTLPVEYVVVHIKWVGTELHIATKNIAGGEAKMFAWDGFSSEARGGWGVGADWIYTLFELDSTTCCVTSAGEGLRFTGGGFAPLPGFRFPVYGSGYSWSAPSAVFNPVGKIAPRGTAVEGRTVYINIDGRVELGEDDFPGPLMPNQPSGLWKYDLDDQSLYHVAGYVSEKFKAPTIESLASSIFTYEDPHGLETGDPVLASSMSGVTGIEDGRLYFAIKVDDYSFKLAYSYADAKNGDAVFAEGTITAKTLSFDSYTSLGATDELSPGAVGLFSRPVGASFFGHSVMFGGGVLAADATEVTAFMVIGRGRNVGSFTTSPIPGSGVVETYKSIIGAIRDLWQDVDSITVKYRKRPRFGLPTPAAIGDGVEWTASDEFEVDISDKYFANVEEGDEVVIISGAGAGYTAHIENIEDSATPILTVTLDREIPGIEAGQFSDITVDNWQLIDEEGSITIASEDLQEGFAREGLDFSANAGQFKVELRGHEVSLNQMKIISETSQENS